MLVLLVVVRRSRGEEGEDCNGRTKTVCFGLETVCFLLVLLIALSSDEREEDDVGEYEEEDESLLLLLLSSLPYFPWW